MRADRLGERFLGRDLLDGEGEPNRGDIQNEAETEGMDRRVSGDLVSWAC